MSSRDWNRLVHLVEEVSAIVSILVNSLMIYLVITKSPKQLGAYKYLMVFISLFEILYAYLDVILKPQHFCHGPTFLVIVPTIERFLSPGALRVLHLIYWWFFGASLAVFAVHFIYRFLVVSGNPLLGTFSSWKIAFWSLVPMFYGLTWLLAGAFLFVPNEATSSFIRDPVKRAFQLETGEYDYIGPYLYERRNGTVIMHKTSIIGLAIILTSTSSSLCIVLLFGYKCYRRIRSLMDIPDASTSSNFHNRQSQLFYALVVQTLIPVLLMNLPAGIMFIFVFLDVNLGIYSSVVSMSIALYPAIDPIPNLFIIKNYRTAVFGFLRAVFSVKSALKYREKRSRNTESSRAEHRH